LIIFNQNTAEEHIWVNSGFSTVSPKKNTVTGVRGFLSPPFAATDFFFKLNFVVNDHLVPDAGSFGKGDCGLLYSGGTWQPDRIIRNGTYHYITGAGLISIYVTTELIPLYGDAGFLLKYTIKNRDVKSITVKMMPEVNAGKPGYYPQEVYYNRPQGPAHKRANIISGIAGAQTILFGMIGLKYETDGSVYIFPQPPQASEINVTDLNINGKSIDIELNNGKMKVSIDKKVIYKGKIKRLKIFESGAAEMG
jgi:hypothetical protein